MKLTQFSAVLFLGASACASNAAVFESARPQGDAPVVSPKNAMLYLADKFGIGDHYALGHHDDAVDFIDLVHVESQKPNLLVVVKGVDSPETFGDHSPSFTVDLSKHNSAQDLVKQLVRKVPSQVAHVVGEPVSQLTDELKMVGAGEENLKLFKYFTQQLPQTWEQIFHAPQTGSESQHIAQLKDSGIRLVNDKLYLSELMQMLLFTPAEMSSSGFALANLDSLLSLGTKIGYDSHTYQVAKTVLFRSISALQKTFDVTIVALGPDHKVADKAHISKRSKVLDEAFSSFAKRGAVAAKSCFADKDVCVANTNSCSGNGKCTQVAASCWQCACAPTTDKKTSKTTQWAGFDCSKKDIAAQAHLLLWTTVAMLVAAVGGVKLLYSIGSESLPGVLQAATIDTSR